MTQRMNPAVRKALQHGVAIPACPLAIDAQRRWDPNRQRALVRYYVAAGAGGLAVGVHTTQFAIRNPEIGLFRPLLKFVSSELDRAEVGRETPLVRIAGVCGKTAQAVDEAAYAREWGYHAALLSLAAYRDADDCQLIEHCKAIADVLPVVGFYLQPSVGGRVLPYSFWRQFVEIPDVVAIKIAPFNRYQTLDVVRAVAESGRDDIALYTGNDDNIVADLLTPFRFESQGQVHERRIVGGLLGQWAVGTRRAVELLAECQKLIERGESVPVEMLRLSAELTDLNAAVFDASNQFAGCIAGIHEVLRRQGLLEGTWCLEPHETLGPGQAEQLDRVHRAYPHLFDDEFIAENKDSWLTE